MLNKIKCEFPEKIPSLKMIAKEISIAMPKFVRYMHPFIFKDIDVPPAQLHALLSIEEEGVCNLLTVSKKLSVSNPTASGLISRLVKSGYVKRVQDKEDRRGIKLTLTKKGVNTSIRFRKNVRDKWYSILKPFEPRDRMGPLIFVTEALKSIKEEH